MRNIYSQLLCLQAFIICTSIIASGHATLVAECTDEYDDCRFEADAMGVVTGPTGTMCAGCISLTFEPKTVTQLAPTAFFGMSSLESVVIANNNLTNIPTGLFDGVESLRKIDLSYNGLVLLPHGVFDSLFNLEELYIQGNSLGCLPEVNASVYVHDEVCFCCEAYKKNWGLAEVQHCTFNNTWQDMASGTLGQWEVGGLGQQLMLNEYEVWMCVENHECSRSSELSFCFVYDELLEQFVPWGDNGCLQLH